MKTQLLLVAAGVLTFPTIAWAQSQPNPYQGSPGSAYPYGTTSEVRVFNGVPCRTLLVYGTNTRVVVGCGGDNAAAGPVSTGSIGGVPVGSFAGPLPYAPRR